MSSWNSKDSPLLNKLISSSNMQDHFSISPSTYPNVISHCHICSQPLTCITRSDSLDILCNNVDCKSRNKFRYYLDFTIQNNQLTTLYCPVFINNKFFALFNSPETGIEIVHKPSYSKENIIYYHHTPIHIPLNFLPFTTNFIQKFQNLKCFL